MTDSSSLKAVLEIVADAFRDLGEDVNGGETVTSAAWRIEKQIRDRVRLIPSSVPQGTGSDGQERSQTLADSPLAAKPDTHRVSAPSLSSSSPLSLEAADNVGMRPSSSPWEPRETPCDCAIEHTGCREVSKPGVYCKRDHGGECIASPAVLPVSPQAEEGGGYIVLNSQYNDVWRTGGEPVKVWLPDGHYVSGKLVQKESGG